MRIGVGIGVALLVVALAGCAPAAPHISVPPTPSVSPMFASDEDALAAAEEAYAAYLAVSDEVGQGGWEDPTQFEQVEQGSLLHGDLDSAADYAAKEYHQVGVSSYDTFSLQQIQDSGPGEVLITAYVCLDVSRTDVVDGTGVSVVAVDRDPRVPLEIDLDDSARPGHLLVSRSEVWAGESFC